MLTLHTMSLLALFYNAVVHLTLLSSLISAQPAHFTDFDPHNIPGAAVTEGRVSLDAPMRNMTKYEGETLRVKCEITGVPLPRYTWYKDGVSLNGKSQTDTGHYNVKTTPWGSRLKIDGLTLNDAGDYTCEGFNRFGRNSTTGSLNVKPGPNPNRGSGKDRPNQEERLLDPDLDEQLDLDSDISMYSEHGKMESREMDGAGFPWFKPDLTKSRSNYGGEICQPYRGATCLKFVGNRSIYIRGDSQQGVIEENLAGTLAWIATSRQISARCGKVIVPALCYYTFPPCEEVHGRLVPQKLCHDDCLALQKHICQAEYAMTSDLMISFPDCGQLLVETDPANHKGCIVLGDPSKKHDGKDDCISRPNGIRWNRDDQLCYNGTGVSYRGRVHTTLSGKECQTWSSVSLSVQLSHGGHDRGYSELVDHNFCRNLDNSESQPWCFITSSDNRIVKESCEIQQCASSTSTSQSIKPMLIVVAPCIGIALFVTAIIVTLHILQRNKRKKKTPQTNNASHVQLNPVLNRNQLKVKEFALSNVIFNHELGTGLFGKVYQGELINSTSVSGRMSVAIRTLDPTFSWKIQAEYWSDLEKLSNLKHENVICLVGTSLASQQPVCTFFEYTVSEDLHEYLILNALHINDSAVRAGVRIQLQDLVNICLQIATGMEYLSRKQYIHGDLAARNIFVANSGLVKISTLRIARNAYSSDYSYNAGGTGCHGIPVRWMSAEAIIYDTFTTESDVWSFAVVVWEVFSYGLQPYHGFNDADVVELIRGHQVLHCPIGCPPNIYSIMVECWQKIPTNRPNFKHIHRSFCAAASNLCGLTSEHSIMPIAFSSSNSDVCHNGTTSTSATTHGALHIGNARNGDLTVNYRPLLQQASESTRKTDSQSDPWIHVWPHGHAVSPTSPALYQPCKPLKVFTSNSGQPIKKTIGVPVLTSSVSSRSSPVSSTSNYHTNHNGVNGMRYQRQSQSPGRPSFQVANYIRASATDRQFQDSNGYHDRSAPATRMVQL